MASAAASSLIFENVLDSIYVLGLILLIVNILGKALTETSTRRVFG